MAQWLSPATVGKSPPFGVASVLNPPLQKIINYISPPTPQTGLPMPNHLQDPMPNHLQDSEMYGEMYKVLAKVFEHNLLNLHAIQSLLREWKHDADADGYGAVSFLDIEMRTYDRNQFLLKQGYDYICEDLPDPLVIDNLLILTRLRYAMSIIISKVFLAMHRYNKLSGSQVHLLSTVHDAFVTLRSSLVEITQCELEVAQVPLNASVSDSEENVSAFVRTISQDQDKLDMFLEGLVLKYRKPRTKKSYWIWYGLGALAISACTIWVYNSGICERFWEGMALYKTNLEQTLAALRDEWYRRSQKIEPNDVKLKEVESAAKTLHGMLLNFIEGNTGEKLSPDTSDHDMLDIVSFKKALAHPIKNFFTGEFLDASLILFEQTKVRIGSAKLLLDHTLKEYGFTVAAIASVSLLPLFGILFFGVLIIPYACFCNLDSVRERKYKAGRIEAMRMLLEAEKRLKQLTMETEGARERQEDGFLYLNGLVLYTLDRFHRGVSCYAQEKQEWQWMSDDINSLRDSYDKGEAHVMSVLSHMRDGECLKFLK